MPPNLQKRPRLDGQQTIAFGPSGLQLEKPPTEIGEIGESSSSSAPTPVNSHRGSVESWRSFAQPKYTKKHPWLVLKPDYFKILFLQYNFVKNLKGGKVKSQFCEGFLDLLEGFQSLKKRPSDYTGCRYKEQWVVSGCALIRNDSTVVIELLWLSAYKEIYTSMLVNMAILYCIIPVSEDLYWP